MKPSQIILLALATLLATTAGCSRIYSFKGVIADGEGNSIVGGAINLYPHNWKRKEFGPADGTSKDDGAFEAYWGSAVGVEFFEMVVTKDGYREHQQLVKAGAKNLRIVLERTPLTAPDPTVESSGIHILPTALN